MSFAAGWFVGIVVAGLRLSGPRAMVGFRGVLAQNATFARMEAFRFGMAAGAKMNVARWQDCGT
jgi:hypothetical protein